MKNINEYIKYKNKFYNSNSSLMRLYVLLLIFICSIGISVLLKNPFLTYTSLVFIFIGVYDFIQDIISPIATDEEINYACDINNSIKEKLLKKLDDGFIIRRGHIFILLEKNKSHTKTIINHQKNIVSNFKEDNQNDI